MKKSKDRLVIAVGYYFPSEDISSFARADKSPKTFQILDTSDWMTEEAKKESKYRLVLEKIK